MMAKLKYGTARAYVDQHKPLNTYWPCRCNRLQCQARRTLPKHPDSYVNGRPRCTFCLKGTMAPDYYRAARKWRDRDRGPLCHCDGLWFSAKGSPHMRGSRGCVHYQGSYDDERR